MCEPCRASRDALSRRDLMVGGGALLAAAALPFATSQTSAQQPASPGPIPPKQALDQLMQGNARYVASEGAQLKFSPQSMAETEKRYPIAAVLACSDSPVPAEIIFDQQPGDLFVMRNAGNIVTDTGLASLEYAVEYLNVSLLMVLGHSNCRAVGMAFQAVRERKELPGHLPELVKAIEPAVIAAHAKHPSDFLATTIEENVRINVKRLIEAQPILTEALAAKRIAVSGGVHDLASGKVKLI